MAEKRLLPRLSEDLAWLAVEADAESCEILDAARKAVARSRRPPRALLTRAVGQPRVETIVRCAMELGRGWLAELDGDRCLVFQGRPPSLADARSAARVVPTVIPSVEARRLARLSQRVTAHDRAERIELAERAFRFARSLDGVGTGADQNLQATYFLQGRARDALQGWVACSQLARTSGLRGRATASALTAAAECGDLKTGFAISEIREVGVDPMYPVQFALNRLVLSCQSGSLSLVDASVALVLDRLSQSPEFVKSARERIRELHAELMTRPGVNETRARIERLLESWA